MASPIPQPTAIKKLKGAPKHRINTAEPVPGAVDVDVTVPPEWMDPVEQEVWRRYAPDLKTQGVLTPWDIEDFTVWCQAVCQYRKATEILREEGEVLLLDVFDKQGNKIGERKVINPWVKIQKDAADTMQKRSARFGMTPSDRSGLKMGDGKKQDPAARLLSA